MSIWYWSVALICKPMQGLQKARKLRRNEVVMQVGNGDGIATQDRWSHAFSLSSRFILGPNNSYFVPELCKNIMFWIMRRIFL